MRAKMRNEEIAAISEAIKILNDDDALDIFKKSLPSAAMIQQQKVKTYDAFLQMHTSVRQTQRHKEEPVAAGEPVAVEEEPVAAAEPVGNNTAAEEPMSRDEMLGEAEKMVKGMVNPMIRQLHEEDVADEQKKVFCAKEVETNEALKVSKQNQFDLLTTEISELEDNLATVVAEIKAHEVAIASLDKEVTEMTHQRKSEHQEFVDEFATMATAIKLIDKAIRRLQKFYSPKATAAKEAAAKEAALKKAGLALLAKESAAKTAQQEEDEKVQKQEMDKIKQLFSGFDSFLQVKKEERVLLRVHRSMLSVSPVEVPDTPKTYVKKESGGVIALMNQFKTDLKTDMTEAEIEEKHAAEDYTRVMSDAQMSRATDVEGLNKKASAKARMDQDLVSAKSQKEILDGEIRNLELYLLQLHHDCDFLLANFDTYHESRIDKEAGLHEALTIVTNEEPPSHRQIEVRYDEEETKEDVEANFPVKEEGEEE